MTTKINELMSSLINHVKDISHKMATNARQKRLKNT